MDFLVLGFFVVVFVLVSPVAVYTSWRGVGWWLRRPGGRPGPGGKVGAIATWHPPRHLFYQLTTLRVYDAVAVDHHQDLVELTRRLAPLRGHHIGSGAGGPVYGGPVALVLAHAERVLGRTDDALEDLHAAWTATKSNGAHGYAVEAAALLAETLVQRGAPGDVTKAAEIAASAATDAEALGMAPWTARATNLTAQLRPTRSQPLTPREEQVAALVARGLTNRGIANALVISERTAQNHVQHILTKLGFTTRSQIAAWETSRQHNRPEPTSDPRDRQAMERYRRG